jgi:hypothetical protein
MAKIAYSKFTSFQQVVAANVDQTKVKHKKKPQRKLLPRKKFDTDTEFSRKTGQTLLLLAYLIHSKC